MKLELKRLTEIPHAEIVALMTHPRVRRHMPLTEDGFDEERSRSFVAGKERLWAEHGYGPWAFLADGRFAGWGGLQPEGGDADLAMIIHPAFWGAGKQICETIIGRAFGELGFDSITIMLPPTRTKLAALARLGFEPEGEIEAYGRRFRRFRLKAPAWVRRGYRLGMRPV